jgi:outer membrane protein assembly factor BamB
MVKSTRFLMAASILAAAALLTSCVQQPAATSRLSVPPATAPDDVLYIVEGAGQIRAIQSDGKTRWTFSVAEAVAKANNRSSHDFQIVYIVACGGDRLFGLATQLSGGHTGQTYLFALAGDHLVWQKEAPPPTTIAPPIAASADALYEATYDGLVYAFAQADGRMTWQRRISEGPIGSLTIGSDGTIYAIGPLGHLHAINADGSERWTIETHE